MYPILLWIGKSIFSLDKESVLIEPLGIAPADQHLPDRPSTGKKDQWEKKKLYETHGVKEYILADPDGQFINRFLLGADGLFDRGEIMGAQEILQLKSIPDIELSLWEVFDVEKPVS